MMCHDCGIALTAEEQQWYINSCEQCEVKWLNEIEAWRRGEPNEKLEKLFSVKEETKH